MHACNYKPCNMCNICEKIGSNLISNFPELFEIDFTRISRRAADNHFWFTFLCHFQKFCIVKNLSSFANSVGHNIIKLPGKTYRTAMGKMPSVREVHGHDSISGI